MGELTVPLLMDTKIVVASTASPAKIITVDAYDILLKCDGSVTLYIPLKCTPKHTFSPRPAEGRKKSGPSRFDVLAETS